MFFCIPTAPECQKPKVQMNFITTSRFRMSQPSLSVPTAQPSFIFQNFWARKPKGTTKVNLYQSAIIHSKNLLRHFRIRNCSVWTNQPTIYSLRVSLFVISTSHSVEKADVFTLLCLLSWFVVFFVTIVTCRCYLMGFTFNFCQSVLKLTAIGKLNQVDNCQEMKGNTV